MTKKNIVWCIIAIVCLGLLGWAVCDVMMFVSTDNAQIAAHSVLLAPKVSGIVQKVFVTEGQRVRAGDPLLQIDPKDFENSLDTYRGLVDSFEAQKANAAKNLFRQRDLLSKSVATQQQYDDAVALLADLAGKVDASKAQVAEAESNLKNSLLVAPSNGFIARRSAEVGQFAAEGVPLIGFVEASERWVEANIKETDLKGIRVGAPVEVHVDALGGRLYRGEVENIAAATGATFTLLPPDNASGNFTKVVQLVSVKIRLMDLTPSDIERLQAGISVEVKIRKINRP